MPRPAATRQAAPVTTTTAAALAAVPGATIQPAGPGRSAIAFLGRSTEAPAPAPTPLLPSAPANNQEPLDLDELYDRLLSRLRRELLDDRERRGRLIDGGRG